MPDSGSCRQHPYLRQHQPHIAAAVCLQFDNRVQQTSDLRQQLLEAFKAARAREEQQQQEADAGELPVAYCEPSTGSHKWGHTEGYTNVE
jgi:hypothetical protein